MSLTGLREERGYGGEDQYPMRYVHEHIDGVTQNNTDSFWICVATCEMILVVSFSLIRSVTI